MKHFILLAITLTSLQAFASGTKEDKFEVRKAKRIEMLDKKIALITKTKSCISAAKDKAAMKACTSDFKSQRKEARAAMKAKREQMRAARKKMKEVKSN